MKKRNKIILIVAAGLIITGSLVYFFFNRGLSLEEKYDVAIEIFDSEFASRHELLSRMKIQYPELEDVKTWESDDGVVNFDGYFKPQLGDSEKFLIQVKEVDGEIVDSWWLTQYLGETYGAKGFGL